MVSEQLIEIYRLLLSHFGPQHWWPGDTQFEIITGAILTQNTSWANVEKAIANLKSTHLLTPEALHSLDAHQIAEFIRPAGYFNVKAERLKNFVDWLFEKHDGILEHLETVDTEQLRVEFLTIKGVGYETADSILLYAFNRSVFVVDAYTARIVIRHGLIEPEANYEQLQSLFQSNLPDNVELFNEYHALLVRLGKEYCRSNPKCRGCPLEKLPHFLEQDFY
jgi:endonuclease-3 related protein